MKPRRRLPNRLVHAALGVVIAVFACLESAPGRLAAAALGERDHRVEIRLAGGHLDLVLRHEESPAENPLDGDHVVHLCQPSEAMASARSSFDTLDSTTPVAPTLVARLVVAEPSLALAPHSGRPPPARSSHHAILLL